MNKFKILFLPFFNKKLSSNGSSLHGISQPRQNLDQGQRQQTRPPSATAFNVNGKSYPKLSSLKRETEVCSENAWRMLSPIYDS